MCCSKICPYVTTSSPLHMEQLEIDTRESATDYLLTTTESRNSTRSSHRLSGAHCQHAPIPCEKRQAASQRVFFCECHDLSTASRRSGCSATNSRPHRSTPSTPSTSSPLSTSSLLSTSSPPKRKVRLCFNPSQNACANGGLTKYVDRIKGGRVPVEVLVQDKDAGERKASHQDCCNNRKRLGKSFATSLAGWPRPVLIHVAVRDGSRRYPERHRQSV